MGNSPVGKNVSATITATAKAVGRKSYQGIADALQGLTDSEFGLADAYVNEVAPGMTTVKQADYDGMAAWLKRNKVRVPAYNTMRTQRAVAVFWPDTARLKGVSFSIHRELMTGNKTYRQAKATARAIADKQGKGSPLTVITVDAIRVHNGKSTVSANRKAGSKVAKAQGGSNAVPVIPVSGNAPDIANELRSQASKLTRAKLGDLSNDELEALATLVNGLAKRIQSETVARAKAVKAAKAPAEKAQAEKVTRSRVAAKQVATAEKAVATAKATSRKSVR